MTNVLTCRLWAPWGGWGQSVDFVSSFSSFSEKVPANVRSLTLMSFGQAPKLNIWFGHVDPWPHHQNTVWVTRSPCWLRHMAFISVFFFTVHQLVPGATVRWARCPPSWMLPVSWETSLPTSQSHTILSFFISRFHDKNRGAKLFNSCYLERDYEKSKTVPKEALTIAGDT